MEAETKSRIHPLVATAAIAVIVLCVVAVAAITGYLPGSSAQKGGEPAAAALTTAPVAAPAPVAPATPVVEAPRVPEPAPAPKAKPVQAPVAKPSTPKAPVVAAVPAPSAPQPAPAPQAVPAPQPPAVVPPVAKAKPVCVDCGVVVGISEVKIKGEGTGLGAVAGGVAGAVLGNQIGSGGGRTIARVAGAAGGAYAGHQVEQHARSQVKYDVGVKMDDGTLRTVSYQSPPTWRNGDRVRIVNGQLELAN